MKPATKDKILQRAARLFFVEGFAVGIDRVTFECDVAKMTIYSEFRSKDGLICAILQEVRHTLDARIAEVIERDLPPPIRLRATFNLLCYGMNDPALKLGLGVRALAEFPTPGHPVHRAGLDLERGILQHLQAGEDSTSAGPSVEAQQLLLLAKGCFLMVPLLGIKDARQQAMELAHLRLNRTEEPSGVLPAGGRGRLASNDPQPLAAGASNP